MSNKKLKIYVGCSLTHATQKFRESIEAFKDTLRAKYEVLQFLGLGAGTPEEIFTHDIHCVKNADLMIADCSYPSIGLGIELGFAYSRNLPVILIAQSGAKVAAMVPGLPNRVAEIVRYSSIGDVVDTIESLVLTVK